MEKEKSRKIKNKMRLERSGGGDTCVEEKKQEKKKKRKGKGEETYGCKERIEGNNNKKIKNHN